MKDRYENLDEYIADLRAALSQNRTRSVGNIARLRDQNLIPRI